MQRGQRAWEWELDPLAAQSAFPIEVYHDVEHRGWCDYDEHRRLMKEPAAD